MTHMANPLFFFFFFTLLNSSRLALSDAIKFDLIHRRHLRTSGHKRRGRDCPGNAAPSGEMPMSSAADFGTGQFLVKFKVGSPPQKFMLVMDTGSDLTWMKCNYRCRTRFGNRCRRSNRTAPVFLPDRSSSFRTLPCSSTLCKIDLSSLFSITRCPSPLSPCAYDYRYADGSTAVGLFANETVTFHLSDGSTTSIDNVLVGCTQSSRGHSFQGAQGVMGLGYSNYSLSTKAANRFGGKFSYCLVDHLSPRNVTSYLTFGDHKPVPIKKLRYTKLILGALPPFYTVTLKGISIGGTMLDIPSETWNLENVGGVIIDSGSSLTTLTTPAYGPVMAALRAALEKFPRVRKDTEPFEFCFNSTRGYDERMVPRMVWHFEDGARFEPHVKSYVIEVGEGYKCLGFVSGAWPGASLIGNIMQQNYFWEFDIGKGRLGFAASGCT